MPSIARFLRNAKYGLPGLYLAGAVAIWLDFRNTNPDGLANIGLVLYTLPVALIGSFPVKEPSDSTRRRKR